MIKTLHMKKKRDGLVYSTDHGKMCPGCNKAISNCACSKEESIASKGPIKIRRETKGRKGKGVTVISNIPLTLSEIKNLAKELKTKAGTGGTAKNGTIEIQGEHINLLIEELKKRGFAVKKTGG